MRKKRKSQGSKMRVKARRMRPDEKLRDVLAKLSDVKSSNDGTQHTARCPAQEDNRNSLSISLSDDGKILVKCHAGCETTDVLSAIDTKMSDLFMSSAGSAGSGGIVDTYDYVDENGDLLYQVCRMDPKDFRQRQPDGNGGWTWSTKGVRHVLYCLPELIAANLSDTVFIVEGEKDVDALRTIGCVATTNDGGGNSKWRADYNEFLRARKVVIIPDNDAVGREHAEDVATNLHGVARSVKVVHLDGLPEKGDVSDWLAEGHSKSELLGLRTWTEQALRLSSWLGTFRHEALLNTALREDGIAVQLKALRRMTPASCQVGTWSERLKMRGALQSRQ